MDRSAARFWDRLATAFRFRAPLTPSAEDIAWYEERVRSVSGSPPRALLLGVTPGIATMRWPEGSFFASVDWSEPMIRNVWPRSQTKSLSAAVRADWRELPLASGSCQIAFCDLLFPALPCSADGQLVFQEVRRALRAGGLFCIRAFIRPDPSERPADLFAELAGGRTEDLLLFRWRLAAAAQASFSHGIAAHDVWSLWNEHVPDIRALAREHSYDAEELEGFNRWKGSALRFAHPTLPELQALLGVQFDLVESEFPPYGACRRIARLAFRAR